MKRSSSKRRTVASFDKKLDYSKNLYFTRGPNVVQWNRKSRKSKVFVKGILKGIRRPGHSYFVRGNGTIGELELFTKKSKKSKSRR